MTRLRCFVSAVFVLALTVAAARGDPISYNEAIDGDLDFLPSPPLPSTPFALDAGTNTVTGQQAFFSPPDFIEDFDGFSFIVPLQTQLESVSVSIENDTTVSAVRALPSENDFLTRGIVAAEGGTTVPIQLSPGFLLPFAAGPYMISPSVMNCDRCEDRFIPYVFSLEVAQADGAPIPEPASLPLLGLGLGVSLLGLGLGGMAVRRSGPRHRRRRT